MLSLVLLLSVSALADGMSSRAINLLNKNGIYISDSDKLSFLRQLCGDTITFNISAVRDVNMFTKEVPDTIWIKKKPKKNPQEGKHYRLSYIYKGNPSSGEYLTPVSCINGKPFGVLSVDYVSDGSSYSFHKDLLIKLIDLDDLSILNCIIPHNNKFSFNISSNKIERSIKSIVGEQFYIKTGNGYSSPKYTLCTLNNGEHSILFDGHIGDITLQSNVTFHFVDKDGYEVSFKYEKPTYSGYYSDEPIVSKIEHEDKHLVRTINSEVDLNIAKSESDLPFNFNYILGTRNGYSAYISQRIVPDNIKSYSWTSDYKTAPSDEIMFVGGSIMVRDTKFLKMIYNGKAFFMKADDVKLSPEDKQKLDSLENCNLDIQNQFWHQTLLLNQAIYYKRLNDALQEIDSYSKYGLAIKNWSVYDESEYTDGTGIRITFLNPTDKVIKYISLSFQGYNAVDDPYGRPVSKKCIGPIDSKETASYNFEYVWFSDVVEYAKIRSIVVTYTNGTTKTISNPSSIMLSKEVIQTIFGSNPVEDFL